MKLSIMLAGLVAMLTLAMPRASAAQTDSGNAFIEQVQACCNCDPHASDMQCFAECNAMLPRCRPPAPRAPAPPPRQNSNQAMGSGCCYGTQRVGLTRMIPLYSACKMLFYNHAVREQYWVTGHGC